MKHFFNGREYDSREEVLFASWIIELKEIGVIKSAFYKPPSIELFDSVKVGRQVLRKVSYTPDFRVQINDLDRFSTLFPDHKIVFDEKGEFLVDVKGTFSHPKFGNSTAYTFPIIQKWVYEKYGVFINKIVPGDMKSKGKITKKGLFTLTFVPKYAAYDRRTGHRNSSFIHCNLLKELCNTEQERLFN